MLKLQVYTRGKRLLHSLAIREIFSKAVFNQMNILCSDCHSHDAPQFLITDYKNLMDTS